MKLLKKTAIWIITLVYLIVVFGFVNSEYHSQLCNKVLINIEDSISNGFISSGYISNMLEKNNIQCYGEALNEINLKKIEQTVLKEQIVHLCKAYTDINGVLHIDITQRKPFVRILSNTGTSFYLDRDGNLLKPKTGFAPHVLVFNGNIAVHPSLGKPITELQDNDKNQKLKEIFQLATYIDHNKLWKSQFVQVYVNSQGEYELIPRIGPHIILLGTIDRYEQKLGKLQTFYEEGLNNIGWNNYLKINLKYKNQVVCTKI